MPKLITINKNLSLLIIIVLFFTLLSFNYILAADPEPGPTCTIDANGNPTGTCSSCKGVTPQTSGEKPTPTSQPISDQNIQNAAGNENAAKQIIIEIIAKTSPSAAALIKEIDNAGPEVWAEETPQSFSDLPDVPGTDPVKVAATKLITPAEEINKAFDLAATELAKGNIEYANTLKAVAEQGADFLSDRLNSSQPFANTVYYKIDLAYLKSVPTSEVELGSLTTVSNVKNYAAAALILYTLQESGTLDENGIPKTMMAGCDSKALAALKYDGLYDPNILAQFKALAESKNMTVPELILEEYGYASASDALYTLDADIAIKESGIYNPADYYEMLSLDVDPVTNRLYVNETKLASYSNQIKAAADKSAGLVPLQAWGTTVTIGDITYKYTGPNYGDWINTKTGAMVTGNEITLIEIARNPNLAANTSFENQQAALEALGYWDQEKYNANLKSGIPFNIADYLPPGAISASNPTMASEEVNNTVNIGGKEYTKYSVPILDQYGNIHHWEDVWAEEGNENVQKAIDQYNKDFNLNSLIAALQGKVVNNQLAQIAVIQRDQAIAKALADAKEAEINWSATLNELTSRISGSFTGGAIAAEEIQGILGKVAKGEMTIEQAKEALANVKAGQADNRYSIYDINNPNGTTIDSMITKALEDAEKIGVKNLAIKEAITTPTIPLTSPTSSTLTLPSPYVLWTPTTTTSTATTFFTPSIPTSSSWTNTGTVMVQAMDTIGQTVSNGDPGQTWSQGMNTIGNIWSQATTNLTNLSSLSNPGWQVGAIVDGTLGALGTTIITGATTLFATLGASFNAIGNFFSGNTTSSSTTNQSSGGAPYVAPTYWPGEGTNYSPSSGGTSYSAPGYNAPGYSSGQAGYTAGIGGYEVTGGNWGSW